jgi:hypothetical protein
MIALEEIATEKELDEFALKELEYMLLEAESQYEQGKFTRLETAEDIDNFMQNL